MKQVTKEKIKSLLRQQVEFDPEQAIAHLEKGDPSHAIRLFLKIVDDAHKRMTVLHHYCGKISNVCEEIKEQTP